MVKTKQKPKPTDQLRRRKRWPKSVVNFATF